MYALLLLYQVETSLIFSFLLVRQQILLHRRHIVALDLGVVIIL